MSCCWTLVKVHINLAIETKDRSGATLHIPGFPWHCDDAEQFQSLAGGSGIAPRLHRWCSRSEWCRWVSTILSKWYTTWTYFVMSATLLSHHVIVKPCVSLLRDNCGSRHGETNLGIALSSGCLKKNNSDRDRVDVFHLFFELTDLQWTQVFYELSGFHQNHRLYVDSRVLALRVHGLMVTTSGHRLA